MARFNTAPQVKSRKAVTNHAGGPAFAQGTKVAFVSLLLTSFLNDTFYESGKQQLDRLRKMVVDINDWLFVAKAAVYARRVFGMRTITHVIAAEIAHHVQNEPWKRRFFFHIVRRPDDMLEIMRCYMSTYGKQVRSKSGAMVYRGIPNAMRRGFADRISILDGYSLAKYRATSKDLSMVDLVNICRPKRTEATEALITGALGAANTWETDLSRAGQDTENKAEAKAQAWGKQVLEGTIGQMALLKNLRNILQDATPETVKAACALLVDPARVKDSLIFPYRYLVAYRELQAVQGSREVLGALAVATKLAVSNVPDLGGTTLVCVDTSASMKNKLSPQGSVMRNDIAALFAGALTNSGDVDLMSFADRAEYINTHTGADIFAIVSDIDRANGRVGHGTSLASAFEKMGNKVYDRIVVLSDMQAWRPGYFSGGSADHALTAYKSRTGANPFVYSIDLAGHGTSPIEDPRLIFLAGFSEKVFDLMKNSEQDLNAMISAIDAYSLA